MARFITTLTRSEALSIQLRERIDNLKYSRGKGLRRHVSELNRLIERLEAQQFPLQDNYKIHALHKSVPGFIRKLITKIFKDSGEQISYQNLVEELICQVDDMAIRLGGTAAVIPVNVIEDVPTPGVVLDDVRIDESGSLVEHGNWKLMVYGLGLLVVVIGVAICYYV
jgi:hypothetical protein